MPFSCSCFISYPHNAGKSVDTFVLRLKKELEDRVAQYVTDPIVADYDFATGVDFNKAIARKICESACLLVVYMPVYQRKVFCLQEYTMMERLQVERYQALQQDLSAKLGMILPLIYTGDDSKVPAWISKKINYKNISKFTIADPVAVFDDPTFQEWLVQIADMVDNLYKTFETSPNNPCVTCGSHDLPDAQDAAVQAKLNVPKKPTESFR